MKPGLATKVLLCAAVIGAVLCPLPGVAGDVSVNAVVEGKEFYLGESFIYQVIVSGNNSPSRPDMSKLEGFNVQFLGGRDASSRSMTIVNGRVNREVKKQFIFSYRLTPESEGELVIPGVTVNIEGVDYRTPSIPITVSKPGESENFKLNLSVDSETVYVGQPVIVDVTWYIAKDVKSFAFYFPFLENPDVNVAEVPVQTDPRREYYEIPFRGRKFIAVKGQKRLDGKVYATLSFKIAMIPRKAGIYDMSNSAVTCEELVGYEKRRDRFGDSMFDDFFSDSFFGGKRGVYKKVVVPGNALKLTVLPVPEEGKPRYFTGLVGDYSISASAEPEEVNVGDPITLRVTVSGSDYLQNVNLPDLNRQEDFSRDFKIPAETAPGEVEDGWKVFVRTIRAKNARVTEIPPILLPYFDATAGEYRVARTKPIPLKVNATRVVTARDAEGREITSVGNKLEAWSKGIAHNYATDDVIKNQQLGLQSWTGSPLTMSVLCLFPAGYLCLLCGVSVGRRHAANPLAGRKKRACSGLKSALRGIEKGNDGMDADSYSAVLAAFREYLGLKLALPPGSVTFRDVSGILAGKGVPDDILDDLRAYLDRCEAGVYSGSGSGMSVRDVCEQGIQIARRLEKKL